MKRQSVSSLLQILNTPKAANWWLVLGVLLLSASHMTYGIGIFAWVSNVPFLVFLTRTQGLKSRLLFVFALLVAWSLATAKIVTDPIPFAFLFLFSVPITLIHLPGYLLWSKFGQGKWSLWLFPVVMIIMEWLQYTFTPFASWGIAAYTQADNLAMMQLLSLFGIPGLSFLVYWVNVSIADMLVKRQVRAVNLGLPIAVLLGAMVFGTLRIQIAKSSGRDTVKIAAIGTDSEVSGLPLATREENEKYKATLFERTRKAAKAGAKLVVWNEAALAILPDEEPALEDSLSMLASQNQTMIVAAYVMATSMEPLQYKNKYLFIDSKGSLLYTYHKHQPVPGEPSQKGTEAQEIMNLESSKIGGAICYDYDFPYLAKGLGKLGADIVVVPSSDWRGIDPIHTKMAAFRAVEQGHSILRSTRFGLSAAITPQGEMVAQMSSFDQNDKIMLAQLPRKGVKTLYRLLGDVVVYLSLAFIGWFFFARKWK